MTKEKKRETVFFSLSHFSICVSRLLREREEMSSLGAAKRSRAPPPRGRRFRCHDGDDIEEEARGSKRFLTEVGERIEWFRFARRDS